MTKEIEWQGRRLTEDFIKRVRAIYSPMAKSVGEGFLESDLHCLYYTINLAVDFHDYLKNASMDAPNQFDLEFACESIFSGVDSFATLTRAYNGLIDTVDTRINWGENPISSLSVLKEYYFAKFHEFDRETNFEHKCRLLLHLFQLQLIFAGMSFDGIRKHEFED